MILNIILDPYIDQHCNTGCHIWIDNKVTTIRGSIKEVCESIYKRVTCSITTHNNCETVAEQIANIGIDTSGVGMGFRDCLVTMGLDVYDIKAISIDTALPLRNNKKLPVIKKV